MVMLLALSVGYPVFGFTWYGLSSGQGNPCASEIEPKIIGNQILKEYDLHICSPPVSTAQSGIPSPQNLLDKSS